MTHTLNDCGCTANVYSDGSGVDIEFCPLHLAAPELLEVLKNMLAWSNIQDGSPSQYLRDAARAAIAKAEATR